MSAHYCVLYREFLETIKSCRPGEGRGPILFCIIYLRKLGSGLRRDDRIFRCSVHETLALVRVLAVFPRGRCTGAGVWTSNSVVPALAGIQVHGCKCSPSANDPMAIQPGDSGDALPGSQAHTFPKRTIPSRPFASRFTIIRCGGFPSITAHRWSCDGRWKNASAPGRAG